MDTISWKRWAIDNAPVYLLWVDRVPLDIVYAPFHKKVIACQPQLRGGNSRRIAEIRSRLSSRPHEPVFDIDAYLTSHDVFAHSQIHLALGLSDNCTLKCIYCRADAGTKRPRLDTSILRTALADAFSEARARNVGVFVSFCAGGEPTFEWDLFTSSVPLIKEYEYTYNVTTTLQMTTNGYYGNIKRAFIASHFSKAWLKLLSLRFRTDQCVQKSVPFAPLGCLGPYYHHGAKHGADLPANRTQEACIKNGRRLSKCPSV